VGALDQGILMSLNVALSSLVDGEKEEPPVNGAAVRHLQWYTAAAYDYEGHCKMEGRVIDINTEMIPIMTAMDVGCMGVAQRPPVDPLPRVSCTSNSRFSESIQSY
jgi:hypothetical protein